jgi:ABC-type phosphate transport system substrate-binding protein
MRVRAALVALLLATVVASDAPAGDVAVIVHPGRDVQLTVSEVARIYLRKRRFWKDGERIVPVNRDSGSAVRKAFVRLVFGASAPQLVVYWNQQYFQGVLPPATLASDEAVKRFVASEPLAIGYIHPGAVDGTVRVVLELEERRTQERELSIRVARAPFPPGPIARLVHPSPALLIPSFRSTRPTDEE